MATAKQIEANRTNALKSTGPTSDEGKAKSRLNAVTHGLTAVLPEAMTGLDHGRTEAEIDEIKMRWRNELKPHGEQQEWLFEMVVIEAIRVKRCQESFHVLCDLHGRRARESWDADRQLDAEALALGLAKNPALVASKLAATPHGCDLMISRWASLRSSLDRHQTWTDNQRSHALDLLGIHPDFRDAETPIDPVDGDELAVRLARIETEISRLTKLRESTRGHDRSERSMAEQTLGAEFTKPVERLDRYERNALRRQQWAWRKLNEAQKDAISGASLSAQPSAEAPKAPQPEPAVALPRSPKMTEAEYAAFSADEAHPTNSPLVTIPQTNLNRRRRRALAALQRRA